MFPSSTSEGGTSSAISLRLRNPTNPIPGFEVPRGGAPPTSEGIRAHKQYALEALKRGTLDCLYAFAGGQGSFSIINANSAEELNERIMETPLILDSEFEVHPPSDFSKYMDEIAAVLEKAGR